MIFDNITLARNWFRQYKELDSGAEKPDVRLEVGEWFLFQHVSDVMPGTCSTYNAKKVYVSRPILALFVGYSVWDMALVYHFVEPERAWTNSHKVITNPEFKYSAYISLFDPEVQSIPDWNEHLHILGSWKTKPKVKELKSSLNSRLW